MTFSARRRGRCHLRNSEPSSCGAPIDSRMRKLCWTNSKPLPAYLMSRFCRSRDGHGWRPDGDSNPGIAVKGRCSLQRRGARQVFVRIVERQSSDAHGAAILEPQEVSRARVGSNETECDALSERRRIALARDTGNWKVRSRFAAKNLQPYQFP